MKNAFINHINMKEEAFSVTDDAHPSMPHLHTSQGSDTSSSLGAAPGVTALAALAPRGAHPEGQHGQQPAVGGRGQIVKRVEP